jgi:hypothetical protein
MQDPIWEAWFVSTMVHKYTKIMTAMVRGQRVRGEQEGQRADPRKIMILIVSVE